MRKTKPTQTMFSSIETGFSGRTRSNRTKKYYSVGNARQCIGEITHGCDIFCLTQGQFSLFDVIEYCLTITGPAAVDISTWTAAGADTKQAKAFLHNGAITDIRWVVDRSFAQRQPEYCGILLREFGDCIRTTRTHAKFITIKNAAWNIAIRTSMNLNSNPRIEDVEISEDADFVDYLRKFVDEVFQTLPPERNFSSDSVKELTGFDAPVEEPIDLEKEMDKAMAFDFDALLKGI
jgi:hypothetical protein